MKIEDLEKEYDKLQIKYGAKELDSIYNGGCEENPDICFIFMNPTGKNIASDKSWKGRKSPWLGTKNIWKLFYKVKLLSEETFNNIQEKKPKDWDTLLVAQDWLKPEDKVLIIDDFMAKGYAVHGLIDIVEQAGAQLMGIGIAVEKGFQHGGDDLREKGYNIHSLAIIDKAEPGCIEFREEQA